MKKQLLFTLFFALSVSLPFSSAKAQGYPTFDVAKMVSLISNLIGRFQPVPQVLSRVNQVKSTLKQIEAAGQAAMSMDLKELGKKAAGSLGSMETSKIEDAATDSAEAGAKEINNTYFAKGASTYEKVKDVRNEREKARVQARDQLLAKSYSLVVTGAAQSAERFKKADDAMSAAGTIHDAINANTLMIMAGNYEKLNQITLMLAELKASTTTSLVGMPAKPALKPTLATYEDGSAVEGKDEADVDF